MKNLTAVLCVFHVAFVIPASAKQDIPKNVEKDIIIVRVTKVKRMKDGCVASVESNKVRYEISSDMSGPCTILRAGEDYKAFVASTRPMHKVEPNDDSADTTVLIVYNNVKSGNVRDNSVFEVQSQEQVRKPNK
jgi:hypothetical protein